MYYKYLEGEKIYLREVRDSDVNEDYYNWLNDPEIYQFLETRFFPRSQNDILNYVRKLAANPNEIFFAICDKGTEKLIGNIKLGPINWVHRKGDISLLIGNKEYWGKGIGTEAIGLVTKFAFETLNLNKVCAGYYESNIGSEKACKKLGFIDEGIYRKEYFLNGKYVNIIRVGLLRMEWEEINSKSKE